MIFATLDRIKKPAWSFWIACAMLALALVVLLKVDLEHLQWTSAMSREGSPPPERDPQSDTGYVLGQRHFLGTHERGETYRWIADTQELIAHGPIASTSYKSDNIPEGRPRLMPRLYSGWLAVVAWGLHAVTGEPVALAVERAALWEPVIAHMLAFAALAAFMWRHYGAAAAGMAGLFFVLFPPASAQFLPGVLTARTWALLFAAYAIAVNLPRGGPGEKSPTCSVRAALAAGLALWLDPAFGFPAVLITAAAGVADMFAHRAKPPFLQWSLIGSGLTLVAWLVDRGPWEPAAGELRYVHPLYALAWLGIGIGLDGWQHARAAEKRHIWRWAEIAAAIALLSPIVHTQLSEGYKGWLYSGAAMRRMTSLDETRMFNTAFEWLTQASFAEIVFIIVPVLAVSAFMVVSYRTGYAIRSDLRSSRVVLAIVFIAMLGLAFFKVRWGVVTSLVALPLLANLITGAAPTVRRATLVVSAVFLFGLLAWGRDLPAAWKRPTRETSLARADLEALIHRHFSQWLATHNPGREISALAPPELSDSLVFHGGHRVLMSTAWEAHVGLVAASRILSAPEASEAEAVLSSREITHVVLTSWDKGLPLLVKQPDVEGKDTLYARLQRWVLPRYLRPIPYPLPSVPGFLDQKLAVFKITPPQDEALALSRVAEYFVEMDRSEPARLIAEVLEKSFSDDPNAAIARALVHVNAKNEAGFERELDRLAEDVAADRVPFLWDRRVQRAIVLALGRRQDLARKEIEACLADVSRDAIMELTPLQAHRLRTLARHLGFVLPDQELEMLLSTRGVEYQSRTPQATDR